MTLDMLAIADAIAARYAPGTLAAPGGAPAIREATARPPSVITKTPMLIVFPDRGELVGGVPAGGEREMTHDYLARLYLAEAVDVARDYATLQAWLSALLYAHLASISLGGLVTVCRTTGWRIGTMRMAGKVYEGVELKIRVVTVEPWSPS